MGSPKLQLQTRKIKESGKLSHSARWCSQAGLAGKQSMPREAFRFTLKPSPSQFFCLPPDKSLPCRSPSGRRASRLGRLRSPRRPFLSRCPPPTRQPCSSIFLLWWESQTDPRIAESVLYFSKAPPINCVHDFSRKGVLRFP